MDFNFQRHRIDKFSESKIMDELEKAAIHFNFFEFSKRDFTKFSGMSASTIQNHYGSWKNGLVALKTNLQKKGLNLFPRPHAPQRIYSDKDLFEEMGKIWQKVGQRPSRTEWEISDPKISIGAYKRRFGSWTTACQKFIEYQMGGEISSENFVRFNGDEFLVKDSNEAR